MRHFLTKRTLIGAEFEMTPIPSLPERFVNITNIEKSAYIPQLRENLFEKHDDKDGFLGGNRNI